MKKFISIILTISIAFTLVSCAKAQKPDWQTSLDLGQKYLLDGNYEQAIVEFNKVIEIEPKNVEAYLGLAEAYTELGDYTLATKALEQGCAETEDERLSERLNEVRELASAQTEAVTTAEITTAPETTAALETTTVPVTTTITTATPEPTTVPTTTTMPATTPAPITTEIVTTTTPTTTEKVTTTEPPKVYSSLSGVEGSIKWVLEDGVLTISGNGEIPKNLTDSNTVAQDLNKHKDEIEKLIIEDGITKISERAFYGCDNLTSVTIPNSVTEIGTWAFLSCDNLTNITIPASVSKFGSWTFESCKRLKDVTILSRTLGSGCFKKCDSLEEVTIPSCVEEWCEAFSECTGLKKAVIEDGVTKIDNSAFYGCDNLISVTIPNSVTVIGAWAFSSCDNLKSITIPASVSKCGVWAFDDSPNLTVYAPAGSYIQEYCTKNNVPFIAQ